MLLSPLKVSVLRWITTIFPMNQSPTVKAKLRNLLILELKPCPLLLPRRRQRTRPSETRPASAAARADLLGAGWVPRRGGTPAWLLCVCGDDMKGCVVGGARLGSDNRFWPEAASPAPPGATAEGGGGALYLAQVLVQGHSKGGAAGRACVGFGDAAAGVLQALRRPPSPGDVQTVRGAGWVPVVPTARATGKAQI